MLGLVRPESQIQLEDFHPNKNGVLFPEESMYAGQQKQQMSFFFYSVEQVVNEVIQVGSRDWGGKESHKASL